MISVLVALSLVLSVFLIPQEVHAIGESGIAAVGWGTTFYVARDGSLYGFGKNAEELIPGGAATVAEPVRIMGDVKSVAVNRYGAVVVKRDGTLWYWGRIGGLAKTAQPVKLMDNVASAALEAYYANVLLVATADGKLYELDRKEFKQVSHSQKVKLVATGGSTKFFINESDELWGWSSDKDGVDSGALGVGHGEPVLQAVKILDGVQSVSSYTNNTLIVRKDGTLWVCGTGKNSKVYTAAGVVEGPVMAPVKVMDGVQHASVYDSRYLVVKRDNSLWVWGTNVLGGDADQPQRVADQVTFAVIGGHIAAIKTDNTLWTGGSKDGVYHAEKASDNSLRLTARDLQDAPAAWALAEVREAEYRKLVPPDMQSGYSQTVTRSEFCTLAVVLVEQSNKMTVEAYMTQKGIAVPEASPFLDVAGLDARAKKDIAAAYALGIVSGFDAVTFAPANPITREQAAKMLTATASALGKETAASMPLFADGGRIAPWAQPYIGYVVNARVMGGVGDNRFDPQGGYQRQQAYMTMLRLYKQIAGQ